MAQMLHVLYGSMIDDSEIARAIALPAGVYEGFVPTIAGAGGPAGWTASLGVDSASGRSAWRTAGDLPHGRYIIEETAPIQLQIAAPSANPRIDFIIGIHKWVAGPQDSVTMLPTGALTDAQRPTYAVVKGTAAATPSDPVIADPYDTNGNRAVILARVRVPVSGAATIERYAPTDLRLDFMRLVCEDEIQARGGFSTLLNRLNSINTATEVQSLYFRGPTSNTGNNYTFSRFAPTTDRQYGSAVTPRTPDTFGLAAEGLYEIMAFHKLEGGGVSGNNTALSLRAWLVYNGGAPVLIDNQLDTDNAEITTALYAQVYVDPTWTDPYIYLERAGWPAGSMRGSVKYLGKPVTVGALGIATGNQTIYESAGQTYPDSFIANLQAVNAVGATTWSIVSGAGALDGASSPAASIVNGNQLKIDWAARPGSFPATYTVNLQVTDSASTPRTTAKTITITLNTAQALSIGNGDIAVTPTAYPYTVTFQPLASGGAEPYTWTIVAGADTTLTGAAYNSGTGVVTGTISADGTTKVRLRVTDNASTQVEKVINITSTLTTGPTDPGYGGGGGCVPAGTLFETVDGPVAIEDVEAGCSVRAYDDESLELVHATVKTVYVYEDRLMALVKTDLGDLRCSRDHRLWRKQSRKTRGNDPHWPPVEELLPGDRTLVEVAPGIVREAAVLEVEPLEAAETVYHVALDNGHVFVAGGFLAHNIKAPTVDP